MNSAQNPIPARMGIVAPGHHAAVSVVVSAAALVASVSVPYRGDAMRVLALTSSYPKFPGDGTAPFIERIVAETARRGHEVDVVLPRHPDLVTEGRSGGRSLRFHPFYAGPSRRHVWGYASSMHADTRLRPVAVAVAPVASLSALRVLRQRMRAVRYDLVHAHWALPNGPIAALAIAGSSLPLVVSFHGSDVFVAEKSTVLRAVARWVLRRAAWANACSRDLAERVADLGIAPNAPDVLPYGVDVAEFAGGDRATWRSRVGAKDGEFVVVGIGRLVAKKGFGYLVRASALLRSRGIPVRLAVGGTGDLEATLLDEARATGCEAFVSLVGNVPHDEVGGLLAAADAVAVPSVRDERGNVDGLPNVLLEAMAAGRPIVASRIGGIPDVVEDERNGLLVPPADATALAAALRRLREDIDLRSRVASAARASAAERSWAAYGDRLMRGYEGVLGEAHAR
jgi:glycosyltransferase involved in cell wall biosynthesis